MYTIREIRRSQYKDKYGRFPFLNDWKRNPYSFLKARFYIETSVILVYFLQKTNISPNMVTILYGWIGVLGCLFLSVPSNIFIFFAVVIFFTKGIFDWTDGLLARIKGQTSITGHVLDGHGALLNDLSFQIGLGFYTAFKTDVFLFFFLIPIIPFLYAASLRSYSEKILFTELLKDNFLKREMKKIKKAETTSYTETSDNIKKGVLGRYTSLFNRFNSVLDARARNVDFICLLLLLEMTTNLSIIWVVFLMYLIKGMVLFMGSYCVTIQKGVIEKKLNSGLHNINNYVDDN